MKTPVLLVAALFAATPAWCSAQEEEKEKKEAPKRPDPRHKEHDALRVLAGDWQTEMKMEAMPGVPGMEKAAESKGTERAELICNGLWVKCVGEGTWQGEPMQGVWLAGYDPHKKKYVCIMACSTEEPSCVMDGSYDEKTKTWTWKGKTPQGEMRSTFVLTDPDTSVETCYLKGADGKETKCMEITRKRAKSGAVAKGGDVKDASAKTAKGLPKESEALHKEAGDWEATIKCTMAGQPASEEKGTETVTPICSGRWMWSDFQGVFMGAPFEGHALYGYDPAEKKFVGYWIDSTSPTHARTAGKADAGGKSYVLEGSCADESGKPMTMKEVITWQDGDTRVTQLEFKSADKTATTTITYKRKGATPESP